MEGQAKIKNKDNETIKAGCAVVNDKGEVLLVSRKDEDIWSFPKGHAEDGETLEDVALREVKEETGYEVKIEKRLSDIIYTHGKTGELIRVAMFRAKSISEPSEITEKDTKSKWFPLEEAKKTIYHNLAFILEELN